MKKILPILTILVIAFLIYKSNLLMVSKVDIQTQNTLCTDQGQISNWLKLEGKYIFLLDEEDIKNSLKSHFPCIGQVEVTKNFPHKVTVSVSGRTPLVKIRSFIAKPVDLKNSEASSSSESALIDWSLPEASDSGLVADSEGYIFASSDESLPILFFSGHAVKVGERLSQDVFQKISQVIKQLANMNLNNNLPQFKFLDGNLLILSEPKIALSLDKDIRRQLASLQLIWQKNTIDRKKMELIDLRFDKPVVVFIPQKRS